MAAEEPPIRLFRCPARMVTGPGCMAQVGREAGRLGMRHPLIVTSPQVADAGHAGRLVALLRDAGLGATLFAEVDDEPTTEHVERGHDAYRSSDTDGVISIGGGSVIDAGKGIAARARNNGPMSRYEGYDRITGGRALHIAMSTTAGTGSEVTRFAVFTDTARDVKMLSGDDHYIPDVAVDDSRLTLSSPPPVTAGSGIDALTHAIEAYVSRRAQPLTDVLALSAVHLVARHLVRAVEAGHDLAARTAMLDASLQAGLAFSNASVALVHGMTRPLGALFHVPHGAANGVLLPHVMAFSRAAAVARYGAIGRALGAVAADAGDEEASYAAIEAVRELCHQVGIERLSAFGVTENGLSASAAKMAADALASGSPANNPRMATLDEIVQLYANAV